MLQIDHVYEFLYQEIFKDFQFWYLPGGVINTGPIKYDDIIIFNPKHTTKKIFYYDQEPLIDIFSKYYLDIFVWEKRYSLDEHCKLNQTKTLPYNIPHASGTDLDFYLKNPQYLFKEGILATSEISPLLDSYLKQYDLKQLYYFFHGFAALDWYRGFYALNYNKSVIKDYTYDYITFNRLVSNDRSYRCYFVSRLSEELLLEHGQVSFGLPTEQATWHEEIDNADTKLSGHAINHIKLYLPSTPQIIDSKHVLGSASSDIPRCTKDSFWHIVTETVFYYDKLHLTEKIFKPIVSKQPFMLVAAPGNLAYLRSYGFKTFEGIIDESYDQIQDPDARIDAIVQQLVWYCSLSEADKKDVIIAVNDIVEYNFHHFYGEFRHIITQELLDNTKSLFKEIGYNDQAIAYDNIYKVLTS
jgi:hypothetical protein